MKNNLINLVPLKPKTLNVHQTRSFIFTGQEQWLQEPPTKVLEALGFKCWYHACFYVMKSSCHCSEWKKSWTCLGLETKGAETLGLVQNFGSWHIVVLSLTKNFRTVLSTSSLVCLNWIFFSWSNPDPGWVIFIKKISKNFFWSWSHIEFS